MTFLEELIRSDAGLFQEMGQVSTFIRELLVDSNLVIYAEGVPETAVVEEDLSHELGSAPFILRADAQNVPYRVETHPQAILQHAEKAFDDMNIATIAAKSGMTPKEVAEAVLLNTAARFLASGALEAVNLSIPPEGLDGTASKIEQSIFHQKHPDIHKTIDPALLEF